MRVQVKDMYICIKKSKSTRFLALKIWAMAVLKLFDVVLEFELPNAWVLNFLQNSAPSLIGPVLINGDCVYLLRFFDCLAHPNLSATFATDQKWPIHISSFLKLIISFFHYYWCQNQDQWHKMSEKNTRIRIFYFWFKNKRVWAEKIGKKNKKSKNLKVAGNYPNI